MVQKRNPVVRDLIQRPLRGAGKHKDKRKERLDADRIDYSSVYGARDSRGMVLGRVR
jgi:hypothetical protein